MELFPGVKRVCKHAEWLHIDRRVRGLLMSTRLGALVIETKHRGNDVIWEAPRKPFLFGEGLHPTLTKANEKHADGFNRSESIVLANQWCGLGELETGKGKQLVSQSSCHLIKKPPCFDQQRKVSNSDRMALGNYLWYKLCHYCDNEKNVTKRADKAGESSDMLSRSKLTSPTSLQCWW